MLIDEGAAQGALRGRDHELRVLDEVLDGTRSGRGGGLVILGEPGMGRTALLRYAGTAAKGFTTLSTRGSESETTLPYAGLHRLLRPLAPVIQRLPEHQADALQAVVGDRDGGPDDVFLLYAAVHRLLSEAARSRPVLCLVDDAQWLDCASLHALSFTGRRVSEDPVLLLFATSPDYLRPAENDPLGEIRRLRLSALDEAAGRGVLEDHLTHKLPEDLAAELVELAAGNPLALIELGAALTPEQISGEEPAPRKLPPESRLRKLFRRRYHRLPPSARRLVLMAAADDRLDVDTVVRAAAAAGIDLRAIEVAKASGLLRVDGDAVRTPGPLAGAALYADAPLSDRHAVHELLAGVLDQEHNTLRRALHRAAIAEEPSDRLAEELDAAGAAARRTGDYAASAYAFQQAAALSGDLDTKARRLIAAATDAWSAGHARQSRALLRQVRPLADGGRLRGQADLLRGEIELRDGAPATAHQVLLEAAERLTGADDVLAVTALMYAGEACSLAGDQARYLVTAKRATHLRKVRQSPATQLMLNHYAGMSATLQGRYDDAVQPLRRVLELAEAMRGTASSVCASVSALALGDDLRAHDMAMRAVSGARTRGTASLVPWALEFLTLAEFWLGRYPSAEAHAAEGLRLARVTGQRNCAVSHLAMLALLSALQGDAQAALLRSKAAAEQAAVRGLSRAAALSSWALACLDLTADRAADAAARLRLMVMAGTGSVNLTVRGMATPTFVEAAVGSGQRRLAAKALAVYDRWATSIQSTARMAVAERCKALLADGDADAEEHFREALRLHRSGDTGFELARTELFYGHRLRRCRKPRAAREHLRNALHIFQQYDATYWVERARAELRAAGESVEPAGPRSPEELTPQQLQIAKLVAEGATNREIAAQLFLSVRTVDHHLRNIFAKLQLRSRVELSRMFH